MPAISDAFLSYAPETGASDPAQWKLATFVKNLADSTVFCGAQQNRYASSYAYAFYPPRTFGLRLEVNW
jgi:iron complex outermembrane receptor protein